MSQLLYPAVVAIVAIVAFNVGYAMQHAPEPLAPTPARQPQLVCSHDSAGVFDCEYLLP